ncbi:uncharacterized protein LOC103510161 [Diaphorina citri]|jgi:DNA-binding nuclear phosphoprotein p8.|uniref:Uncharacterized protein LOC103510161 n=1 Tax=Diaphorina citri TaxID=121845 RepID=A0A1S3D2S5_DIACI|nr:uncharacterized protein LOC103510161 [Diaphorina citri]XP_008473028.1 uncharacterized protein LOC103510161 [Diaphorina citri]XP_017299961.1 uncharacterized protein LOC103510161 [Diaphorina citri]XP_026680087.1 uncharacterized protein LOC103510161 [Diaphorina citri]XP_026680088.1 uncharacterized protein LOC103510161 [Diaphorina citri]XP_026680089.1 uncharacterized protein LOC103510161 [Diaphorina citri]XP_026680090.1 uncharacterized protein LOC103510161 [Diaphorina citri]XP_026680091.1 unc
MSATTYDDEYEEYNYEQDKIANSGHSGKQRSKKEQVDQKKTDPAGHSRKIASNLQNSVKNNQEEASRPKPVTRKEGQPKESKDES